MGKRPAILLSAILLAISVSGQNSGRLLAGASSCYYKQRLYVFGYEQRQQQLVFRCFLYGTDLKLLDSTEYALGKSQASQFLSISQDTLHDVLNFYFQKADLKNRVSMCRLDSNLRLMASATDLDASHINSITAFGNEYLAYKTDLYRLTSTADSSGGRQFFLTKHSVKAMDKPFEYEFRWQYAFERKHIHHASLIAADAVQIILSAHVNDGPKKGQWILLVDAQKGTFIKGIRLSSKGDERHFLYSKAIYDPAARSLVIAGSILPAAMIDFRQDQANFKNLAGAHHLFLANIDSLGEIRRYETALALPAPVADKPGTRNPGLHCKIRELGRQGANSYTAWADLYRETLSGTLSYYSSWHLQLITDAETLSITSSAVYPLPKLIPDLISTTPGNRYGQIPLKVVSDYDEFLYEQPLNPVIMSNRLDEKNQPGLLLRQVNILSGQTAWMEAVAGDKGVVIKPLFRTTRGQSARIYPFGDRYILFSSDAEKNQFQLDSGEL